MSLVLLCPPVIVIQKNVPIVTAKSCRLSMIHPSDTNVYEVEILEAPPVEVNVESSLADYYEQPDEEEEEEDAMINFISSRKQHRPYRSLLVKYYS